jgi:cell pole-organizing protein PopZ
MSGSTLGGSNGAAQAGTADPSMEDILASIRRILSEDESAPGPAGEPAPAPPPPAPPPPPDDSDVLALDASMLVEEPPEPDPPPPAPLPPPPAPMPAPVAAPALPEPEVAAEPEATGLLSPVAQAAAAASVGSLMRTLVGHQSVSVYRGGPTLEDIVREEMRPMLKQWLDENLPPLVERLVRAEIERVVGRSVP